MGAMSPPSDDVIHHPSLKSREPAAQTCPATAPPPPRLPPFQTQQHGGQKWQERHRPGHVHGRGCPDALDHAARPAWQRVSGGRLLRRNKEWRPRVAFRRRGRLVVQFQKAWKVRRSSYDTWNFVELQQYSTCMSTSEYHCYSLIVLLSVCLLYDI